MAAVAWWTPFDLGQAGPSIRLKERLLRSINVSKGGSIGTARSSILVSGVLARSPPNRRVVNTVVKMELVGKPTRSLFSSSMSPRFASGIEPEGLKGRISEGSRTAFGTVPKDVPISWGRYEREGEPGGPRHVHNVANRRVLAAPKHISDREDGPKGVEFDTEGKNIDPTIQGAGTVGRDRRLATYEPVSDELLSTAARRLHRFEGQKRSLLCHCASGHSIESRVKVALDRCRGRTPWNSPGRCVLPRVWCELERRCRLQARV